MSIIDNKNKTMLEALQNALSSADRVDIEVGFFYMSGFELLATELANKQVRILVGKYIDPSCVPDIIAMQKSGEDFELERFMHRTPLISRTEKKEAYIKSFIELTNHTSLFDQSDSQKALKLFMNKIEDGSLEIKISPKTEHGKLYILHNKKELSQGGDFPGTVLMGSSNLTYHGLKGQGELNDEWRDITKYKEYLKKFEELWSDGENIDLAALGTEKTFIDDLKNNLWLYQNPSPYEVYVRVLHELFHQDESLSINTPSKITNGEYSDLEYQIDAVRIGLDRIEKYDGVIIADVVGLGKSIIASAIANNLDLRSLIIVPPHLKPQWENYQHVFRLPGAVIKSSGNIREIYEEYTESRDPLLIIIDEAHRFRNEDTDDYKMLHQICRGNPGNKVMVLTATPFNNDPKDVFALVRLFQTPGQSTIKSVDNLSLRFRELIERYKKLRIFMRKTPRELEHINQESEGIARELRRLIEPVIIRRSRIDIQTITRYREDLERQNIEFSKVVGPELMTYELGQLTDLYIRTLDKITAEDNGFIGARYKPAAYIKEGKREEFVKQLGNIEETDLVTAQTNLVKFMRRLLVTRFESSKEAFKSTLNKMIDSNKLIERWWLEQGKVPIQKKGQIPDPDNIIFDNSDDINEQTDEELGETEVQKLNQFKNLSTVDKELIEERFIKEVQADIKILEQIKKDWFEADKTSSNFDPKIDYLIKNIKNKLQENPDRKIVVFSAYADTVNYLYSEMTKRGQKRIFKYTAADSSENNRKIISENFDAGIDEHKQRDDFDVLIATDALSEGYNLHRAGIVINYDIPYNPTRVTQRIGRINRINKKVFDEIFIYNFFPTEIGEAEIRIRQISTVKMRLINYLIGNDTRTLTDDEDLIGFIKTEEDIEKHFKDEFEKEEQKQEQKSWDADCREDYDQIRKNSSLMQKVLAIKPRSRVVRDNQKENIAIAFGKKGSHAIFAIKPEGDESQIVGAETVVPIFKAIPEEKGKPADEQYDEIFALIRDTLFAKHPLPKIAGRRAVAISVLKILNNKLPQAKISKSRAFD